MQFVAGVLGFVWLGWPCLGAYGYSFVNNAGLRGVDLVVTPEPGAVPAALALIGLLGGGRVRRRAPFSPYRQDRAAWEAARVEQKYGGVGIPFPRDPRRGSHPCDDSAVSDQRLAVHAALSWITRPSLLPCPQEGRKRGIRIEIDPAVFRRVGSRSRDLPLVFSDRVVRDASETTNGRRREISRLPKDATTRCASPKPLATASRSNVRVIALPTPSALMRNPFLAAGLCRRGASLLTRLHLLNRDKNCVFNCPLL